MARISQMEFCCPHCGHKQLFPIYEVINTRRDIKLLQGVIDQSLFNFVCDECKQRTRVGYEMVLKDPEHKCMLALIRRHDDKEAMGIVRAMSRRDDTRGYSYRFVNDLPELSEKLLLLTRNLDDRTVEHMKMAINLDWADEHKGKRADKIFLAEDMGLKFMLIDRNEVASADFSQKMYDEMHAQLSAFYPQDVKDNLFVDDKWVLHQLKPPEFLQ